MQSLAASGARQPLLAARRPAAARQPIATAARRAPLAERRRRGAAAAAAADEAQAPAKPEEVDLEEEVERFMRKQAELESGGETRSKNRPLLAAPWRFARAHDDGPRSRPKPPPKPTPNPLNPNQKTPAAFARTRDVAAVIGADAVPDDAAKRYCREIVEALRTLKETRDMSVAEVKLIVSIDDPRARERAVALDVEDSRGVSRDEMAAALMDVAEGRVPKDRIALRCLHEEVLEWPFLNDASVAAPNTSGAGNASAGSPAPAARGAPTAADYASLAEVGGIAKPYVMGKDARAGDKPQTLADLLPDWMGFGVLYGISAIPVMLAVGAILVLFYNSLR
jgi:hypothetical protein